MKCQRLIWEPGDCTLYDAIITEVPVCYGQSSTDVILTLINFPGCPGIRLNKGPLSSEHLTGVEIANEKLRVGERTVCVMIAMAKYSAFGVENASVWLAAQEAGRISDDWSTIRIPGVLD